MSALVEVRRTSYPVWVKSLVGGEYYPSVAVCARIGLESGFAREPLLAVVERAPSSGGRGRGRAIEAGCLLRVFANVFHAVVFWTFSTNLFLCFFGPAFALNRVSLKREIDWGQGLETAVFVRGELSPSADVYVTSRPRVGVSCEVDFKG